MPVSSLGQLITFATEQDADMKHPEYIWVQVKVGDTVRKIAARRGHPEDARAIAKLNKIRSVTRVLLHRPKRQGDRTRIRVPGTLRRSDVFHVLAGDSPPRLVAGYQKLTVIDRPGRTGLTHFEGYDPLTMEVPIRFEQFIGRDGEGVEERIARLERMAGRGNFKGASAGSAAIIRIATTDNAGHVIPLVPPNFQWSQQNPSAPQWRIADIDWDENPIRDDDGNRIRQGAVVTVMQHTRLTLEVRSVSRRRKDRRRDN
jgi:hypothetical protein